MARAVVTSGSQTRRGNTKFSGRDRAAYGCLISFEADDGSTLTLHRTGPRAKAIRTAVAIALAQDETYRVVSYSTPETIFTDLTGGRVDGEHGPVALPEIFALGLAKLPIELCHPRIRRAVSDHS